MKKLLFLSIFASSSIISQAQTTYSESEIPGNLPSGIFYQHGNGVHNWSSPYSTKLTVNENINRNFELSSIAKENEGFKVRQFSATLNGWTGWRNLILDDGNGKILLDPKGAAIQDYFGFKVTETGNTTTKFHIFRKFSNDAQDISRLVIDANGNVGIGTATPSKKLHIVTDDGGINYLMYLGGKTHLSGNAFGIGFNPEGGNIGSANSVKTAIVVEGNNTGWNRGNLHILQNNNQDVAAATLADAVFTVTPTGKIGIGTTIPKTKLDVDGGITASLTASSAQFRAVHGGYGLMLRNDGTNTYFLLTDNNDAHGTWNNKRPLMINNATGNLQIHGDAIYARASDKHVGIGTNQPSEKLTVDGNI
jgi:hypothetical protein